MYSRRRTSLDLPTPIVVFLLRGLCMKFLWLEMGGVGRDVVCVWGWGAEGGGKGGLMCLGTKCGREKVGKGAGRAVRGGANNPETKCGRGRGGDIGRKDGKCPDVFFLRVSW
jgi:hypothetical protein